MIHSVLFWLKEDLTEEDRVSFENQLRGLSEIPSVTELFVGTPANTQKRPVVESSYDYCLTVLLEDVQAHDAYQVDPIHLAFVQNCSRMWDRVRIHDAD